MNVLVFQYRYHPCTQRRWNEVEVKLSKVCIFGIEGKFTPIFARNFNISIHGELWAHNRTDDMQLPTRAQVHLYAPCGLAHYRNELWIHTCHAFPDERNCTVFNASSMDFRAVKLCLTARSQIESHKMSSQRNACQSTWNWNLLSVINTTKPNHSSDSRIPCHLWGTNLQNCWDVNGESNFSAVSCAGGVAFS